jgi:hypothetical protein
VPGFHSHNQGIITSQYDGTFFIIAMMLIQGFTFLLTPWDNVDIEEIMAPVKFRIKSIPKFAVFFGLIISLFDVAIFLIMIYGFNIPRAMSVSASSTDSATQYATIRLFQTV